MLNLFQQSIRQRFQSQAFLESQILFQELNGAAAQAHIYLLKLTPNQLQEIRLRWKARCLSKVLKTGQEA